MKLRIFTEPQQGATYDDLLRVALAAERLGYSAFFRSDHYAAMSGDGLPGPTDSWVTLGGIARAQPVRDHAKAEPGDDVDPQDQQRRHGVGGECGQRQHPRRRGSSAWPCWPSLARERTRNAVL